MLTLKSSLFKYKNSHTSSDWEPSVPLSSITPPKRKQRRTFYLWVMFFLLPRASSGNWRNSQFFLPKTMRYLAQAGFHSFGVLPSRISWLHLSPPTFTCWLEQCFCLFCGRGFFFLYCAEKGFHLCTATALCPPCRAAGPWGEGPSVQCQFKYVFYSLFFGMRFLFRKIVGGIFVFCFFVCGVCLFPLASSLSCLWRSVENA